MGAIISVLGLIFALVFGLLFVPHVLEADWGDMAALGGFLGYAWLILLPLVGGALALAGFKLIFK